MIKRSLTVAWIIAVLAAEVAIAADQQITPVGGGNAVVVAQQAEPSANDAPASGESNTETTPDEPVLQEKTRKPPNVFGLAVGSYSPINDDVKDAFGGTKWRIGLRPLLTETPKRARLMYDVSFYSLDKEDNQAILIPLTAGIMKGFGQETKTQTYAAINAGVFYGDVDAPTLGISESGWGFTANATLGLIYNKRLSLEVRYEIMEEFAGFNFYSFSMLAAYKVLSWRF